jgi:hypothetical protein
VDWHVKTESQHDSLAYLLANWPLPAVGSTFDLTSYYPEFNGVDTWAYCTPELTIAPHRGVKEQSPTWDWIVTQTWSTKTSWRCQTFPIEDPLDEPWDISGGFTHEQKTAMVDRFGNRLQHPNFQPITGPATEYKYGLPTITIGFNKATLPLSTYVELVNHVNDAELWGLPARCVRFSDAKWTRKTYGNCNYYFAIEYTFEFDINTFDKPVPAEGTTELEPGGNPGNPASFIPCKINGENVNKPLDFYGRSLTIMSYDTSGNPVYAFPQYVQTPEVHEQGNLLLLGIPSTLS